MLSKKSYVIKLSTVLVILIVGIIIGWKTTGISPVLSSWDDKSYSVRLNDKDYRFISPLLASGDRPELRLSGNLEHQLSTYIKQQVSANNALSVSIYYRDFSASKWIGINEQLKYSPASMYKVVYLIAYLKIAETDPSFLDKKIVYDDKDMQTIPIAESNAPSLQSGESYTVAELLRRMIIYSDNKAAATLTQLIPADTEKKVFSDLNLTPPDIQDQGDTLSPQDFSLFFRILYNGSYLSREMSEYALHLLSQTDYRYGLVDPLPENTIVSHKYGRRTSQTNDGSMIEELHDCGLIYKPQHPYLLCVMTKAKNAEHLPEIIQHISALIYSGT